MVTKLPRQTFRNLPPERQQRFLAAALAEFAAHGYRKASLNRLVQGLGIAKGSVYRYFANKEALFHYLFEDFVVQAKWAVRETAAAAGPDFFAQVRAVFTAGLRFLDEHPLYYRLYLQVLFEAGIPGRRRLLERIHLVSGEYLAELCRCGQERGELRPDVPPSVVAFTVTALLDRFLQGCAHAHLDGGLGLASAGTAERARLADTVTAVLRHGLAVPATPDSNRKDRDPEGRDPAGR